MDNATAWKLVHEYDLRVPKEFGEYSFQQLAPYVGGCGPGGIGDMAVPDTLYFLSVKPACFVHDFYYSPLMPRTIDCKEEAEMVFLQNMIKIIELKTRFQWLKWLRIKRARKYAYATTSFGWSAFLKSKDKTA